MTTHHGGFSLYELAEFLQVQNEKYGDKIEVQRDIKNIIDSIFMRTHWVIELQFLVFLFGFCLPFMIQLFYTRSAGVVVYCVLSCLITQVLFLGIEVLQMRKLGLRVYASNVWNLFDCSLFLLFCAYACMRLLDPSANVIPQSGNTLKAAQLVFWIVMNSLLLVNALIKVLFFLRVYGKFGMLVQLIISVVIDIKNFIFFFVLWLILFSLLYRIAGIKIDEGDYKNVNSYLAYVIVIFRNSIGDEQIPDTNYWTAQSKTDFPVLYDTVIGYSWALWLLNACFMLIMLLNFLIAIISQSYDQVMTNSQVLLYNMRCDFNMECALLYDFYEEFRSAEELGQVYVVSADVNDEQNDNQFTGFVKPIKDLVRTELDALKGRITTNQKEITTLDTQLKEVLKLVKEKLPA